VTWLSCNIGRVGKTSILARWTANQFDDGQAPTQAAAFFSKKLVIDGKPVEVAVWDTAGQERFHALGARHLLHEACHRVMHSNQWRINSVMSLSNLLLGDPCVHACRPNLLSQCWCGSVDLHAPIQCHINVPCASEAARRVFHCRP
jgi:Ras family